jgi:LPS-assembly protein
MTSRSRILTPLLLLCHLLLVLPIVTSQLLPVASRQSPAATSGQVRTANGQERGRPRLAAAGEPGEEVIIEVYPRDGLPGEQEKRGDVYTLRGQVVIRFRSYVFRADEVIYNEATGGITATGHIIFDGGPHDEHIEAARAEYNIKTDNGQFHDVIGTTGARFHGNHVVLTSSNPFVFRGSLVVKDGPNHLVVSHGMVTSCQLPNPKWTFNAEKIVVDVGDEARIYHTTFRLFHVPILYLPFAQHPVDNLGRQTGFLIPTIGQSSRKGTILGEGVYWAINRSMDATIAAEYFSHRGWAQHGEFRAKPSQDSYINATYFGVLDRGYGQPHVDQGGEDIRLNAESKLPLGFRGVADIDYLSSFVFRLAFAETFSLAVNSEVRSTAFASRAQNGYFFNLLGSRYQNFQSTTRGDLITILHVPSLDLASVDRRLGRSPFYWSYDAAAQGVSRREPQFVTEPLVGRFDVHPTVSLPLVFGGGWSLRPEVGVRETYYTQRRNPLLGPPGIGTPIDQDVNRRAVDASVELRPPALSKIFDRQLAGYTIKHAIEPRVTYRFIEGVDNFPAIIRFDYRDILADTNEVEYALVNRIYAKSSRPAECTAAAEEKRVPAAVPGNVPGTPGVAEKPAAPPAEQGCQPVQSREIVTWEVKQKYFMDPNFGGALVAGRRNVFTTTADFTGIAFLTEPRRFSPLVSRVRVRATPTTDGDWQFDYDTKKGRINASTVLISRRFGDVFVAGSHAFLHVPGEVYLSQPIVGPEQFNQLRWLIGYGHPNKRGINAAANVGFDIHSGFLQYSAFQASYNWDCCGLSVEYRRFALGSVRNENQFRFALSLTNVGTFGTLRRQERLF